MNEDILKGKWHEVRGSVKTKWGKLTDDDLTAISGQTALKRASEKAEKLLARKQSDDSSAALTGPI